MCLCVCVCFWRGWGTLMQVWTVERQKDGKTEIIFHVISLATSLKLWSPHWQILCCWPERQLVIPAHRQEGTTVKRGTEFGRADLAAAQTQASVANPLYSPINPHGCAHPVRTPVWACQHSPMEPGTELCRQYGHQAHYRPNQILLIARVRPRSLL